MCGDVAGAEDENVAFGFGGCEEACEEDLDSDEYAKAIYCHNAISIHQERTTGRESVYLHP